MAVAGCRGQIAEIVLRLGVTDRSRGLQYVESGENGNFVADGDNGAVERNHQEAIGAREGGDVSGTLPT